MPDTLLPPPELPPVAKERKGDGIRVPLGAVAGAAAMMAALKWLGPLPTDVTAHPWAATVAALLATALTPLIHELGHVAGGLLAGFRFV